MVNATHSRLLPANCGQTPDPLAGPEADIREPGGKTIALDSEADPVSRIRATES